LDLFHRYILTGVATPELLRAPIPDADGLPLQRCVLEDVDPKNAFEEDETSMRVRRCTAGVVVVVACFALAGCNKHETVAVVHSCPLIAGKKIVVTSDKGAIGMAKIALTPKELKADDCRS
jgi:hypothetical protein